MSKEKYLLDLKKELNILDYYRINDALKKYSERFDEAKEFGVNEKDLIQELGDPKQLAKSINNELYLFPTFMYTLFI